MRRRWLGILATSAAALAIPAGAGAATPVAPIATTQVQVSPTSILPRTNIVIRFRQPQTTGQIGSETTTESLRVTGPSRPGCVGSDATVLAPADVGRMMRRTLRPAPLGGTWCIGSYSGQLMVATEPTCQAGPIHAVGGQIVACPMFMMLPRTVATFRFRVIAG